MVSQWFSWYKKARNCAADLQSRKIYIERTTSQWFSRCKVARHCAEVYHNVYLNVTIGKMKILSFLCKSSLLAVTMKLSGMVDLKGAENAPPYGMRWIWEVGKISIEKIPKISASGQNFLDPSPLFEKGPFQWKRWYFIPNSNDRNILWKSSYLNHCPK